MGRRSGRVGSLPPRYQRQSGMQCFSDASNVYEVVLETRNTRPHFDVSGVGDQGRAGSWGMVKGATGHQKLHKLADCFY